MVLLKRLVVGVAAWVVLFVALAPDALWDGTGFYWTSWTFAFGAALAVCVAAAISKY